MKEIPERTFFFKMVDIVRAECYAAKLKAFLPIQALISRVLKQRKFKYDEGVSLNEQEQLFYLQMIAKNAVKYSMIKKMADPTHQCPG